MLSIIIPTYKRSQLLARALDSVFAQNCDQFEVVLVDDNSQDDTQSVINQYQDPRLHSYENARNQGVSYNRNFAVNKAQGEYCLFLDDDDSLAPQCVERVLAFLRKHPVDFSWVGRRIIASDGLQQVEVAQRSWQVSSAQTPNDLAFFCYWANPGFIIKRSLLQSIGGYDETMSMMEDIDLLARLLHINCSYHAIPDLLLNYYIEKNMVSLSRHHDLSKEIWHIEHYAHKNTDFLAQTPIAWQRMAHSLLGCYYRQGNKRKARQLAKVMLRKHPLDVKLWGRLFEFEFLK